MKRRDILAALGQVPVLALAGALPTAGRASVSMGDITLTSVSDGTLTLPDSMSSADVPQDELAQIRAEFGIPDGAVTRPCNVTLLQTPDRTVLFDVGAGQELTPTTGNLPDTLDALGVAPEDVTDIVFTHAHPDHLWGLLDDFGDGEEILPGVAARATFGHTPGHMAFEIRAGSEALMIIGDSVTNHHVGFVRPDWPSGGDQDKDLAATTRAMLLDQLAQEKTRILGFHLPGNGLGRVERKDGAFQFIAEAT